ncbi:hypothetical protein Tsubulata_010323 [Turnera subulata]|uniref:Uncharacterized protein n=1 Tax=Turnera subulata TaxID=218843 RepID=A0A9Q0GE15_9ROSI|nr:hypothetical protein Tsubulata_010323 [Turnera subulata]
MAAGVTVSYYCKKPCGQFVGHSPSSHPYFVGKLEPRQQQAVAFRGSSVRRCNITALFSWGSKKSVKPKDFTFSLGEFTLPDPASASASEESKQLFPQKVSISIVSSINEVPSDEWDACNLDATTPQKFNPFLSHAFLSSLEDSGSAVKETGWVPSHMVAKDAQGHVLGVVPLYLKSHSYGEFVFDHSWADAYYNFGARYYPKFQCCVPFTPVTGPRILVRNSSVKDQVFDVLVSALKELTVKSQVSSLHITFASEKEWLKLKGKGFLQRTGMQYHWKNRNYKSFDEFLMDLKANKRKHIRQERKKISAQNLKMKRLRGYEIKAKHWDSFYKFYRNTTDNKWGSAYLTRDFFHIMGAKMGDQVLLVTAEEGDELVAGALNLVGGDTLFGRLWGCRPDVYYPNLHFEACYYQVRTDHVSAFSLCSFVRMTMLCNFGGSWDFAFDQDVDYMICCLLLPDLGLLAIEAAIELSLNTVEAGAQGEHKIQRGYLPVKTYSCHYLIDEGFRKAIQAFLVQETDQVELVMKLWGDSGPFKEGIVIE